MAPRVLLQFFFFLLPFILFGLYRLAIVEAEQEGRKPWPIRVLFGIGLALGVGSWLLFIFLGAGERETCYRESRFVNGEMVRGEEYPCEKDLTRAGKPLNDDPGGVARGVGNPKPAGPAGATPRIGDETGVEPTEIDENTDEQLSNPER